MEEVYTCGCGCQEWTVCGHKIECVRCGARFVLVGPPAHVFNAEREKRRLAAAGAEVVEGGAQ